MSFIAVLLALVIEQLRPLPQHNPVHEALVTWSRWTGRNFDAGQQHHAVVVWAVTVVGPSLLVGLVFVALNHYSVVLALAWNLVVLYLTLGFRQFSHYFTDIRESLEQGREDRARELLQSWRNLDASELPRTELLRHVLEHGLLAAHRHVFGVFFWFVLSSALGLGPTGAVLYRLAEFSSRYWGYKSRMLDAPTNERLMQVAQRSFAVIDHLPSRLTAAGFAVVGNFEDAIDCWRNYADQWLSRNDGVVLASAAGAMAVALGGQHAPELMPHRSRTFEAGAVPEEAGAEASTPGLPPQVGHLRSVVGLVWRSVVLWMMLLALLGVANLLG
jgi:adenosylcobinamide-phosphate synthase